MDPTTIRLMVEVGEATPPDIANHFSITLKEAQDFLAKHKITSSCVPPRSIDLLRAERLDVPDWESFLYEDDDRTVINGVNIRGNHISVMEIVRWYHGEDVKCLLTKQPTTAVMAWDGNTHNFLITNVVPITHEAAKQRYVGPSFMTSTSYSHDGLEVTVHLLSRYDKLYGSAHKVEYVDEIMDYAVMRYAMYVREIAPSADLLCLWAWRQLSRALLKGLCRVDIKYQGVTSTLTADQYNVVVRDQIQNHIKNLHISPLIVPPNLGNPSIVAPNQGNR